MTPAASGFTPFLQMLAWQYVEVPLLVLLPVQLLPLLERAPARAPRTLSLGS